MNIRKQLVEYGKKIAHAGLVAGAGGNISAREGNVVWMKPSGFAMDDMKPADLCGMNLKTGKQVKGSNKPTSEVNMHLEIYRVRPEISVIFHTHEPWASGIISSSVALNPMFAEHAGDLGTVGTVPYVTPTTQRLADAMAAKARTCDTIFMINHGVLAVGTTMKQSFDRCVMVENAAKAQVADRITHRKPRFITKKQAKDLLNPKTPRDRIKMM
mgnify:CR=1 FL=1